MPKDSSLDREKVRAIAKKDTELQPLPPNSKKSAKSDLLAEVKLFEKKSLAGEYYQSFGVNSKNYMETSPKTRAWIAEFDRLLQGCVAEATKGDPVEVRSAMDVLFGLLKPLDEAPDRIVFFADEGGSRQVGVDWEKVLPVWFEVLSATAEPVEFAERITTLLSRHCSYRRDKMLEVARRIATTEQRQALLKIGDR